MADVAQLRADLEAIEAKLTAGRSSVSFQDRRTDYDLEALERRAEAIRKQIVAAASGSQFRRVVFRNA